MYEITLEAKRENLEDLFRFLYNTLGKTITDSRTMRQIKLCAEEVFLNVACYAYYPDTGSVTVRIQTDEVYDPPLLFLSFIDQGKQFNPLSAADPDTDSALEERKPGGLGIFLIRTIMNGVSYEYTDGQNVLTLMKKLQ